MSLKGLTKEQKQYLVLAVIGGAILVVVAVFGIKLSLSSISEAKQELADLTTKIDSADRTLSRRKQTSGDFVRSMKILKQHLKNAPPERNYYSWATEVIYSRARKTGLEIDTIDEINVPQSKPGKKKSSLQFESYSLRIMAHGGYNNTKMFIKQIKQGYPLVRVAGIDISKGSTPDTHDIQLFIQWPFNLGAIAKNWDSVESQEHDLAEEDSGGANAPGTSSAASDQQSVARSVPAAKPAVAKVTPTVKPLPDEPRSMPTPSAPHQSAKPARQAAPTAPKEPATAAVQPARQEQSVDNVPLAVPVKKPVVKPAKAKPPVTPEKQPAPKPEQPVAAEAPKVAEPVAVATPVAPKTTVKAEEIPAVTTNQPASPKTAKVPQAAKVKPVPAAHDSEIASTQSAPSAKPAKTQTANAEEPPVSTNSATPSVDAVAVTQSGPASSPAGKADTSTSATEPTGTNPKYVSTEKSARKLKAILMKKGKTKDKSLNALLDSLMEDTHETK